MQHAGAGAGFPVADLSLMLVAAAATYYEGREMASGAAGTALSHVATQVAPTGQLVSDLGAMTAFFVVALAFMAYYLFYLYPQERAYQREQQKQNGEQLALSRLALETSNKVIAQNSEELRFGREQHTRLGERIGGVEDVLGRHDERAERMCNDLVSVKTTVEGLAK